MKGYRFIWKIYVDLNLEIWTSDWYILGYILNKLKELPRVNKAQDPVEDKKSQLLSFSEILLEFCSILVKVY